MQRFSWPRAGSLIAALSSGKLLIRPGSCFSSRSHMVCASAWHPVVVVSNVWIGLCRMLRILSARARSTSLRPFGTLLPATGAGI